MIIKEMEICYVNRYAEEIDDNDLGFIFDSFKGWFDNGFVYETNIGDYTILFKTIEDKNKFDNNEEYKKLFKDYADYYELEESPLKIVEFWG